MSDGTDESDGGFGLESGLLVQKTAVGETST